MCIFIYLNVLNHYMSLSNCVLLYMSLYSIFNIVPQSTLLTCYSPVVELEQAILFTVHVVLLYYSSLSNTKKNPSVTASSLQTTEKPPRCSSVSDAAQAARFCKKIQEISNFKKRKTFPSRMNRVYHINERG